MNRILIATLAISCIVFAKINPQSEQTVNVPSNEQQSSTSYALVTPSWGVSASVANGEVTIDGFSVGGENFSFVDLTPFQMSGCESFQLIDAGVGASSFFAFCFSSSNYSFTEINISGSGFTQARTQGFPVNEGETVQISGSAFVTQQGNIYIGVTSEGQTSIVQFGVSSWETTTKIQSVEQTIPGSSNGTNGTYTLQDMHSLPYDAGVSVILNAQDGSQVFAFCYFNGTTFVLNYPTQTLIATGRHRGSNFGYTLGNVGGGAPYGVVTAWDLSDHAMTNSINIKGGFQGEQNGHFSTDGAVYVFANTDNNNGNIYSLPYAEFGFLPNSVSSVSVSATEGANLADGHDGTWLYCYVQGGNNGEELGRWTF